MSHPCQIMITMFFLVASIVTVHAEPIIPDGTWYEFSFVDVGTMARGCFPADTANTALDCIPSSGTPTVFAPAPSWTFTLDSPEVLTVTDAFLHGDAFEVFDNGNLIFSTPLVTVDGSGCGDDPVICLADPSASHFSQLLSAGVHSIMITAYATYDAGSGYFQVIPEPATVSLLSLAIPILVANRLWAKRRK